MIQLKCFTGNNFLTEVYHLNMCQPRMGPLRVVSYDIHPSKVSQRLCSLETLKVITESVNTGSFQKTKKRFIVFASTPLLKRRRNSHPSYDATFEFRQELNFPGAVDKKFSNSDLIIFSRS